MRILSLIVVFLAFGLNFANAQKFGYIDSDFILNKMPEYGKAQGEIDQLSASWQKEIEEMQKKVFGFGGLFFLKKQELIKPLQDKVFDATGKVAKANRLAIIFDKAGELVMIYTDPRHDYTDFVLEELGLGDPNDKVK